LEGAEALVAAVVEHDLFVAQGRRLQDLFVARGRLLCIASPQAPTLAVQAFKIVGRVVKDWAEAPAHAAVQDLAEARGLLRAAPAPGSAARALIIVGHVVANWPLDALDAVRKAERAVRDVVVLRCCSTTAPRDRDAFRALAEEAFGGAMTQQLHSQLHLAYKKVVGSAADAFPSNSQMTAARRGGPRPRRRRSPPPREEARAAGPARSALPAWDWEPMWLQPPWQG
jgi:hypothetical protein